jgi:hypothetical protein
VNWRISPSTSIATGTQANSGFQKIDSSTPIAAVGVITG